MKKVCHRKEDSTQIAIELDLLLARQSMHQKPNVHSAGKRFSIIHAGEGDLKSIMIRLGRQI